MKLSFLLYKETGFEVEKFCKAVQELLKENNRDKTNELTEMYRSVTSGYTATLQHLYKKERLGK